MNAQRGTLGKMEQTEIVFAFGPFRLRAKRRLLLKGDHPVPIGSRALEILIALIERSGELVIYYRIARALKIDKKDGVTECCRE